MNKPLVAFWVVGLSIVGAGLYGFIQGVPERDIVSAVRTGDLPKVKRLLERDPNLANAKVYPQAVERADQRRDYETRTGKSAWQGTLLIHEAVGLHAEPVPMLEALVAAGARLDVRRNGRTLLHDAASQGNVAVAAWLVDRGADVNAANDCSDGCAESGRTPLYDALRSHSNQMIPLLMSRGARVDAAGADGRTALHVVAANGGLGGAFILCRLGADPARKDAKGKTPHDLALSQTPPADATGSPPDDPAALPDWLKPAGGCEEVAALARQRGSPVSEDDARVVYGRHACARGMKKACGA